MLWEWGRDWGNRGGRRATEEEVGDGRGWDGTRDGRGMEVKGCE